MQEMKNKKTTTNAWMETSNKLIYWKKNYVEEKGRTSAIIRPFCLPMHSTSRRAFEKRISSSDKVIFVKSTFIQSPKRSSETKQYKKRDSSFPIRKP